VARLFPPECVPESAVVRLPEGFVASVNAGMEVEDVRPGFRVEQSPGCEEGEKVARLMVNVTERAPFVVEFKPKVELKAGREELSGVCRARLGVDAESPGDVFEVFWEMRESRSRHIRLYKHAAIWYDGRGNAEATPEERDSQERVVRAAAEAMFSRHDLRIAMIAAARHLGVAFNGSVTLAQEAVRELEAQDLNPIEAVEQALQRACSIPRVDRTKDWLSFAKRLAEEPSEENNDALSGNRAARSSRALAGELRNFLVARTLRDISVMIALTPPEGGSPSNNPERWTSEFFVVDLEPKMVWKIDEWVAREGGSG